MIVEASRIKTGKECQIDFLIEKWDDCKWRAVSARHHSSTNISARCSSHPLDFKVENHRKLNCGCKYSNCEANTTRKVSNQIWKYTCHNSNQSGAFLHNVYDNGYVSVRRMLRGSWTAFVTNANCLYKPNKRRTLYATIGKRQTRREEHRDEWNSQYQKRQR